MPNRFKPIFKEERSKDNNKKNENNNNKNLNRKRSYNKKNVITNDNNYKISNQRNINKTNFNQRNINQRNINQRNINQRNINQTNSFKKKSSRWDFIDNEKIKENTDKNTNRFKSTKDNSQYLKKKERQRQREELFNKRREIRKQKEKERLEEEKKRNFKMDEEMFPSFPKTNTSDTDEDNDDIIETQSTSENISKNTPKDKDIEDEIKNQDKQFLEIMKDLMNKEELEKEMEKIRKEEEEKKRKREELFSFKNIIPEKRYERITMREILEMSADEFCKMPYHIRIQVSKIKRDYEDKNRDEWEWATEVERNIWRKNPYPWFMCNEEINLEQGCHDSETESDTENENKQYSSSDSEDSCINENLGNWR